MEYSNKKLTGLTVRESEKDCLQETGVHKADIWFRKYKKMAKLLAVTIACRSIFYLLYGLFATGAEWSWVGRENM